MHCFSRFALFTSLCLLFGAESVSASSSGFSSHSSSSSSSHSHLKEKRCRGIGWYSLRGAHRFLLYRGHQADEKKLVGSFGGHELGNLQTLLAKSNKKPHFFLVALDERGEKIHSGKILVKGGKAHFCQPPCVRSHRLPIAQVNEAYEAQIERTRRSSHATFKLVHGQLPKGLKLSSKGLLFGVPTEEGRFEFVVLATSPCGAATEVVLRLQVGCPPVKIITEQLADGDVGVSYYEVIALLDEESDTTFNLLTGDLPPGLELSSQGVIAGHPTQAGTYDFIVEATNACGHMAAAAYSITIANPCVAPVIVTTLLNSGTISIPYTPFQIQTTGGVGPITFSLVAGTLPLGLTLSPSGVISGTPSAGAETSTFTVEATSSCGLSTTQELTIQISD